MKKLLFILLLLPTVAMSQFKQGVGFEYYTSNATKTSSSYEYLIFNNGDFATLYKLQYDYKDFKAEALTSIYMDKGSSYQFKPTHSEFTVALSYSHNKMKIKVEHQCVHPILTDSDKNRVKMYDGHTKIGVYYDFD